MRTALISLAGQPRAISGAALLALGGKTLAHRQLDFALALGCEGVIVLGDGASAEAINLRHVAEAAGARFRTIKNSHGLLAAVRADDELLVLAPGLLPEAPEAVEALSKGRRVLVFPAGPAIAAGFERIDLNRAWAGALVVGGAQVERLSELPPDIVPASALVRIAMQANVPERPLSEELLANGSWKMFEEGADQVASERAWIERHAPVARTLAPTRWLARLASRAIAARALAAPHAVAGIVLATLAALAGAVLAVSHGWAAVGFGLVAVGALLAQGGAELARLRRLPFGGAGRSTALHSALPWLVDAAIFACVVLAIEGSWLHRLFPPLVLLGMLYAVRSGGRIDWAAVVSDRGALALGLAVASGFDLLEPAVMLVAIGQIALNLARSGATSG